MPDWFENDDLFRRELEAGHRWASRVTERLVAAGVPARLTPIEWRDSIEDRHRFAGEKDIVVDLAAGPFSIESKSRDLRFTGESGSYPYRTAFIDTVSGWDQKPDKPRAVVLSSQQTGDMLVVNVRSTRGSWTVAERFDRVRSIHDRWYEVDRSLLRPFESLVVFLVGQLSDEGPPTSP